MDNGLLYIDLTQFGTRRTNLSQAPSQANVLWVLEIPVAPPFRAFHKMFMYTDTADVSRYLVGEARPAVMPRVLAVHVTCVYWTRPTVWVRA